MKETGKNFAAAFLSDNNNKTKKSFGMNGQVCRAFWL